MRKYNFEDMERHCDVLEIENYDDAVVWELQDGSKVKAIWGYMTDSQCGEHNEFNTFAKLECWDNDCEIFLTCPVEFEPDKDQSDEINWNALEESIVETMLKSHLISEDGFRDGQVTLWCSVNEGDVIEERGFQSKERAERYYTDVIMNDSLAREKLSKAAIQTGNGRTFVRRDLRWTETYELPVWVCE